MDILNAYTTPKLHAVKRGLGFLTFRNLASYIKDGRKITL